MPAKKKIEENETVNKKKSTTAKSAAAAKRKPKKKPEEMQRVEMASVNEVPNDVVIKGSILDKEDPEDWDMEDVYEVADALMDATFYDVEYDREVFMELRKIIDAAYAKRNKSKADEDAYDEAIFNLTSNCVESAYLQDFMGYCYKKGKYDFCLMNFEKYLKWTILAAARGNAFSLSKLQLFFSGQLDALLVVPNMEKIMENFELEYDQFVLVLTKKLCDQIVYDNKITPETMIKEPEVLVEQSEPLMRKYERIKNDALEKVKQECVELIRSIEELDEQIRLRDEAIREVAREENEEVEPELPEQLTEEEIELEATKQMASSNKFVRSPNKKKFRW